MDDADLYGDLYGADEYDDPSPTDASTSTLKSEDKAGERVATKPATAPSSEVKKTSPQAIPTSTSTPQPSVKPPVQTQPQPQGQPIPTSTSSDSSYSTAITNSIPTYVSHHESSRPYGDRNFLAGGNTGVGGAAAVANAAGGDSTVRPSEMRDEGKMFVGGLNWETTTESLMEYFSQFGKIDACTIMRDAAGRSRGFAFLTFEDPAAVNAVMVREHHLDGKIIDPKRAIPRLEHQRTQKLFVGGLAPSVTTDTLKQFFGQYGKVIDATVMVDRDSSRSKGFGFVTFEDGNGVDHLLGHGLVIDGKPVEVKLAQPRHAQQQQQQQRGDGAYSQGSSAYNERPNASSGTGAAVSNPPAFDANAMAQLYQRMMSAAGGGFMGNPMMGGMMANPMMASGMMGGMGRGMGMGMMGGMGGAGNGMMGSGGAGMVGGGGMVNGGGMGGGMNQMGMQIPRGPRMMQQGQQAQQQGAGPMRTHGMRGQNTYHPYGRS